MPNVTALAIETGIPYLVDEFSHLNRCLDNAIADAVASTGGPPGVASTAKRKPRNEVCGLYCRTTAGSSRSPVSHSRRSRQAISGPGGATGDLLEHTLKELEAITARLDPTPVN